MTDQHDIHTIPDVPDDLFHLRPYRRDAYGESIILKFAKTANEANEMRATKARVDIARLIAWAGVIILIMITSVSLWVFLFGADKRLDEATRFLILIMGAVVGAIFRSAGSNEQ